MALSVKLDAMQQDRLRQLAEQRDRSPHYLMREAIQQYLDREEARESFLREAMASWEHYRETGLHVTGDEFATWLDGWGTDKETAPPEPHE